MERGCFVRMAFREAEGNDWGILMLVVDQDREETCRPNLANCNGFELTAWCHVRVINMRFESTLTGSRRGSDEARWWLLPGGIFELKVSDHLVVPLSGQRARINPTQRRLKAKKYKQRKDFKIANSTNKQDWQHDNYTEIKTQSPTLKPPSRSQISNLDPPPLSLIHFLQPQSPPPSTIHSEALPQFHSPSALQVFLVIVQLIFSTTS